MSILNKSIKHCILLLLLFSINIYSKEVIVGVNLPGLVFLNFSVISELPVNEKLTTNFNFAFRPNLKRQHNESLYSNLHGASFTPELRYYVRGYSKNSLFIGPYLRKAKYLTGEYFTEFDYWSGLEDEFYEGYSINDFGVGLNIGVRFVSKNKYAFDFFLGPRISKLQYENRVYHYPNATLGEGSTAFENYSNFPNLLIDQVLVEIFDEVDYETTLNYDKYTATNVIPALRIGFTFNYFIKNSGYRNESNESYEYYKNEEY